jgi:hypothetical protein
VSGVVASKQEGKIMKSKSRAVLTAGLGTVLSLSMATSAPAAVTSLDIGSGSLEAKGLIATVPLTFTCDAGAYYSAYVFVRQIAQQRTITQGDGSTSGSCTGESQTVTVQVRPNPKPFKKGTAVADATVVSYCYFPELGYYDYCGDARVTEEIQLR